jgi:hypothetical protein
MKKNLKAPYIMLLLSTILFSLACKKQEESIDPNYRKPVVSLVTGSNTGTFFISRTIKLDVQLTATGFLDKLEVKRNGTVIDTKSYTKGGAEVYNFEFKVAPELVGTSQVFTFDLFDKKGNKSDTFTYTANISNLTPTYEISTVTINNVAFNKVTGTINIDETFTSTANWLISGVVSVADGNTLTIQPGTTIYAETAGTSMNVIIGGKIIAEGTAAKPIVFTTINTAPGQTIAASPGDWLALNVNGNATTNSGIYKYVRVEFAGGKSNATPSTATDAFKLINVANTTLVDYVQVFRSNDNGLRINGGNVNVKHVVVTANVAAGMRFGVSWTGNGQFIVANLAGPAMTGIQGRDLGSFPTLSNITITGSILNGGTVAEGEGIRIRNNAKAKVHNAVVTGVGTSFRASDGSENFIPTGEVYFRNGASFANTAGSTTGFHSSANSFNPSNSGYVESNKNTVTAFEITNNYIGTIADNALDPTTLGAAFTAASYIGAVEKGKDWTAGWTKTISETIR